jgi:hypothetical protein
MVATASPLLDAALAAATAAGLDANEATRVFACSDYLTESFARQPALFAGLDLLADAEEDEDEEDEDEEDQDEDDNDR